MSSSTPKTTIVEFTESTPNVLVPSMKHVETLKKRIGSAEAIVAVDRLKGLLTAQPGIHDVSYWANEAHIVRGRVVELEATS